MCARLLQGKNESEEKRLTPKCFESLRSSLVPVAAKISEIEAERAKERKGDRRDRAQIALAKRRVLFENGDLSTQRQRGHNNKGKIRSVVWRRPRGTCRGRSESAARIKRCGQSHNLRVKVDWLRRVWPRIVSAGQMGCRGSRISSGRRIVPCEPARRVVLRLERSVSGLRRHLAQFDLAESGRARYRLVDESLYPRVAMNVDIRRGRVGCEVLRSVRRGDTRTRNR